MKFQDLKGLENEIFDFKGFPGFQGPVHTLSDSFGCFWNNKMLFAEGPLLPEYKQHRHCLKPLKMKTCLIAFLLVGHILGQEAVCVLELTKISNN